MHTMISKIVEKYSAINDHLASSRSRILWFSLFAFLISAMILSYYAWYHIQNPVPGYSYDIDGWAHLIPKMIETGKTWELLTEAVHHRRNFLVPFIYGLSYCFLGIPESVHILNILLQSLSSMILVWFLSAEYKRPLLGFFIGFLWAVWPPFSQYFGYYYSEAIYGLVFLLLWVVTTLFLKNPKWTTAAWIGVLLATSMHVKATCALVVVGMFFCCLTIWRDRAFKYVPIIFLSLVIAYAPWPLRNYFKSNKFVPLTQSVGGAGMWELLFVMTYVPGDGMLSGFRDKIPEYREIKAKGRTLKSVAAKKRYYRDIIIAQVKADPAGQAGLILKRFLRFWYWIRAYEWIPTTKSLLVMTPLLLLAVMGSFSRYRDPNVQVAIMLLLGMWALHGIVHSEFRYQFPVFPMLLFLSFGGIASFVNRRVHYESQ